MKTTRKLFLTLVLLISVLMLTGCGKTIDLEDYVEVTVSGANGYGRAYATLDEAGLLELLLDGGEDETSVGKAMDTLLLLDEIDVELDSEEGLSNGDKLSVTITYPASMAEKLDANIRPKSGSSWSISVSDLTEAETVDLFENYQVSFSGFDGYGAAQAANSGSYSFRYTLSCEDGLANGDTVILYLEAADGRDLQEYCIERYGIVPAATSKEYTVTGLKTPGQVDLFEDLDITVDGHSPYLSVYVLGKYENDGIRYELMEDDNGTLAIGDTVTIQAISADWSGETTLEEECLNSLGALPMEDTYTYTIGSNTPYFVTDSAELTGTVLDFLIREAEDVFAAEGKAEELIFQGISYAGYYLQTAKRYDGWGDYNRVYIIHAVNYTLDGISETHYSIVKFWNVTVEADGSCRYDDYYNLYGWAWGEVGAEEISDFEHDYITADAVDYRYISGE